MIKFPGGGNGSIFDSPDLFQEFVKDRIMFLELGADEGIEVVSIKVGFGSFGEVFHRSGGGIGADFLTGVRKNLVVKPGLHGLPVGGEDAGFVVAAQDLVMKGVAQFVENDRRVFCQLIAIQQRGRPGDVTFLARRGS